MIALAHRNDVAFVENAARDDDGDPFPEESVQEHGLVRECLGLNKRCFKPTTVPGADLLLNVALDPSVCSQEPTLTIELGFVLQHSK